MRKSYFILLFFYIALQVQSQARTVEGYVMYFMGVGLKNTSVFFSNDKLTDQIIGNGLIQKGIGGKLVYEAKTDDQGFYRIDVDSSVNLVFLMSYDEMYVTYKLTYVLKNPVIYVDTKPFSVLEAAFGSANDRKTIRHKKFSFINEQGNIIESGRMSRIVTKRGAYTIKEGVWKQFYNTGMLKLSGTYKKGKPVGPFILYNEQGEIILTMYYEDGRLTSYIQSIHGDVKNFTIRRITSHTLIELHTS